MTLTLLLPAVGAHFSRERTVLQSKCVPRVLRPLTALLIDL